MATLGQNLNALSEHEVQEIRAQLSKILNSHPFSSSKRYGPLLKCLVEHSLDNEAVPLKERTIGSEVFGRSPDYDTSTDPIVRVAIAEVRKRLAQYYVERNHQTEVQIELLPGSYQPRFAFPQAPSTPTLEEVPSQASTTADPNPRRREPISPSRAANVDLHDLEDGMDEGRRSGRRNRVLAGLLITLCAVATVAAISIPRLQHRYSNSERAMDQFWQPVFTQQSKLSIVLPSGRSSVDKSFDPNTVTPVPVHLSPDASLLRHLTELGTVNLDDAAALAKISQLAGGKISMLRVFSDAATELADLREGPVVLIGAVDNAWTLKATQPLRFHVERDRASNMRFYIADRERPENRTWAIDFDTPVSKLTRDYALIARIRSRDTGQQMVVVSGLGGNGTIAAAEFLTNPDLMEQARKQLSASAWTNGNIEIILQTDTIGDTPTPPEIIASTSF